MGITINFNLKSPSKEHSLLFAIIRVDGKQLRVSTQQNVLTASFDSDLSEKIAKILLRQLSDTSDKSVSLIILC